MFSSWKRFQTRVTRMFAEAIANPASPLVSYYGAIVGLCELGHDVQKVFILPNLRAISER